MHDHIGSKVRSSSASTRFSTAAPGALGYVPDGNFVEADCLQAEDA
jgi:hypothetical protein